MCWKRKNICRPFNHIDTKLPALPDWCAGKEKQCIQGQCSQQKSKRFLRVHIDAEVTVRHPHVSFMLYMFITLLPASMAYTISWGTCTDTKLVSYYHPYFSPCCFDQLKCICQSVSSSRSICSGMTYNVCNAAINCAIPHRQIKLHTRRT